MTVGGGEAQDTPELSVTCPFSVYVSSSSHLPGLHLPLFCISLLYCLVIVCVSAVRLTHQVCHGLPSITFPFLFSIQIPETVGRILLAQLMFLFSKRILGCWETPGSGSLPWSGLQ